MQKQYKKPLKYSYNVKLARKTWRDNLSLFNNAKITNTTKTNFQYFTTKCHLEKRWWVDSLRIF